jgi:hypothetical protein
MPGPRPRAICRTERSRRNGKIYKGRRNTVFRPEHEILPNWHLYYAPVKVNPRLPQAGDYGGIAKAFSGFSEIKRHWGTG